MTDSNFTNPASLEVDHLVALSEAHRSGAALWDLATKEAYANDLDLPYALAAIFGSTNSRKSDYDPAKWLPPNEAFRRTYVIEWIGVKVKWGLTSDVDEMNAIRSILGVDTIGLVFPKVMADLTCGL